MFNNQTKSGLNVSLLRLTKSISSHALVERQSLCCQL